MHAKETQFPSASGVHTIYAYEWKPPEGIKARGVLVIVHGMREYAGRYDEFASYLAQNGFHVYAHDLTGHGKSIHGAFGYAGDSDIAGIWIKDTHNLVKNAIAEHPDLPIFMFGHSMGSFVARMYARDNHSNLSGIIYSGTSGKTIIMNMAAVVSGFFARSNPHGSGCNRIAQILQRVYTQRVASKDDGSTWVSRDPVMAQKHKKDPLCNFALSNLGFYETIKASVLVNRRSFIRQMPTELPTLIMSGADDPLGQDGIGVMKLYMGLCDAGNDCVKIRIYENGRHEMINEINRKEVYADILQWMLTGEVEYNE